MSASIFAALLVRLWRQHRVALLLLTLGVAIFEFVITRVAPLPGETGFFGGLAALLPPDFSSFVNEQLALASPAGVVALGYLHPFFLALLSAWTIRIGAGALGGEIGRGTMDILASRPLPRWSLVAAAWIAIAGGLGVILAAGWMATSAGLAMRPLGITGAGVWKLPVMAWLLFLAWAGLILAIGATRRDAGVVIAWVSGLIATSFVLEFLSRLWQPLASSRSLSLFAYYTPQTIVTAGPRPIDVIVLSAVAVTALGAAIALFERRDL